MILFKIYLEIKQINWLSINHEQRIQKLKGLIFIYYDH